MRLHPHEGILAAFRCPQEPREGFLEEAAELILTGSLWAIREAGGEAQPGLALGSSHRRPTPGEGGNQWRCPGLQLGTQCFSPPTRASHPGDLPAGAGLRMSPPPGHQLTLQPRRGMMLSVSKTHLVSLLSSPLIHEVLEQRARL